MPSAPRGTVIPRVINIDAKIDQSLLHLQSRSQEQPCTFNPHHLHPLHDLRVIVETYQHGTIRSVEDTTTTVKKREKGPPVPPADTFEKTCPLHPKSLGL
jgi:hypothetical protein